MSLRVIILCGSANSGKSKTLRKLRDNFFVFREGIPYFKGKPVHFEIMSLQEQCKTCNDRGQECVVRTIGEWVDWAIEDHASLLIIPFTMKYSRGSGELNKECIRKPLTVLRRRRIKFSIVYLRREHKAPERNDDMDDVMRDLFDRITESRKGREAVQARNLFQFIRSIA